MRCIFAILLLVLGGCAPTGTVGRLAQRTPDEQAHVEWRTIGTPDGDVRLAIARPSGKGSFPAVIILHGRHGFAREYVKLASDLAAEGIIGVAACWFDGGGGAGSRFVTPIACAEGAPSAPDPAIDPRPRTIAALVRAVRAMPDVSAVALIGHSRGGGTTASYLLSNGDVEAAVLNSAGYSNMVLARAGEIRAPVLILHGIADSPTDGGSAFTQVARARSSGRCGTRADPSRPSIMRAATMACSKTPASIVTKFAASPCFCASASFLGISGEP